MQHGGVFPGLSVERTIEAAFAGNTTKVQKLDIRKLAAPLRYVPDDLSLGGDARDGHGVLVPVGDDGRVDQAALDEWAANRESQTETPHPLTQLVLNAIVQSNMKRPQ